VELAKHKVKAMVCLGIDNTKLHQAFEGVVKNITDAKSMKEAVQMAYFLGNDGDTVLLSPACASFDLFENYEDRGRQFKNCIKEL
jgi:UDP-N-acetylmuramoylalanine--D-glutamate ligase